MPSTSGHSAAHACGGPRALGQPTPSDHAHPPRSPTVPQTPGALSHLPSTHALARTTAYLGMGD
eukprot:7921430-Heterocapsa_arctica.AAC.1